MIIYIILLFFFNCDSISKRKLYTFKLKKALSNRYSKKLDYYLFSWKNLIIVVEELSKQLSHGVEISSSSDGSSNSSSDDDVEFAHPVTEKEDDAGQKQTLSPLETKMRNLQVQSFSFLSDISTNRQALIKYRQWCFGVYFVSYVVVGLISAAPGPMLSLLQQQVHASLEAIAWIFSLRAFGYVVGSVASGYLLDMYPYHSHNILAINTFVGGITILITPYIRTIEFLAVNYCIQGNCLSFVDCVSNVCLLALFRPSQADASSASTTVKGTENESGPYMQALHFFFAVGALLKVFFFFFFFKKSF
ncbi:hypothetical protein RFI_24580 [Reticulomyxa filosa]|uniref:Uncharacterized protein n=1 Tax=Reticulomyxa filosa TaxID=46433 RepID=X6MFK9_RETFI|nr:hypothetical protein RFI_24580 [Reticulomyxa filosa]|eukprot:ETO12798.1 hypothetical protein RFI_24580 [Reticulomyxa filosa]